MTSTQLRTTAPRNRKFVNTVLGTSQRVSRCVDRCLLLADIENLRLPKEQLQAGITAYRAAMDQLRERSHVLAGPAQPYPQQPRPDMETSYLVSLLATLREHRRSEIASQHALATLSRQRDFGTLSIVRRLVTSQAFLIEMLSRAAEKARVSPMNAYSAA